MGGFAKLDGAVSALYTAPIDAALVAVTGEPSLTISGDAGFRLQDRRGQLRGQARRHHDRLRPHDRAAGRRTAVTGYAGMEMVGDRTPMITFEAEQTTEAGFAFWASLLAGTQMACSFSLGATQYNKVDVSLPTIQFKTLGEGDKNGIATYKAVCQIVSASGVDDDISIVFN